MAVPQTAQHQHPQETRDERETDGGAASTAHVEAGLDDQQHDGAEQQNAQSREGRTSAVGPKRGTQPQRRGALRGEHRAVREALAQQLRRVSETDAAPAGIRVTLSKFMVVVISAGASARFAGTSRLRRTARTASRFALRASGAGTTLQVNAGARWSYLCETSGVAARRTRSEHSWLDAKSENSTRRIAFEFRGAADRLK
jgi:hypothetical protein